MLKSHEGRSQTTITLIGTVHNSTVNYTKQDLYRILKRLKADVILVELDSTLLTPDLKFKKEFLKYFENSVVDSLSKKIPQPSYAPMI